MILPEMYPGLTILGPPPVGRHRTHWFEISNLHIIASGTTTELPPPPGLLVIGGQSLEGPLSAIETFGFEDDHCIVPALPETRYGLAAFKTSSGHLGVCGGWWSGKPYSTDCLTLKVSEAQWVRGTFKGALSAEGVRGVATFENNGTYIIHSETTSYLDRSDTWTPGPSNPVEAECGCRISNSSYVIVGSNRGRNILEYSITFGNWQDPDRWPELEIRRKGPGCAATSNYLLVAGGVTEQGVVLTNVEIFRLDTFTAGFVDKRTTGEARNLLTPRSFFTLVPVGLVHPRLFAIGGRDGGSFLHSTEFWDQEQNEWEQGPALGTGRSSFGAIMIEADFACADILLPHTCPTTDGGTCVFSDDKGKNTIRDGGSTTL